MNSQKHTALLPFFVQHNGYFIPYHTKEDYLKISQTIYPYLIGKYKSLFYLYDLKSTLPGISASFRVCQNIIENGGKVLFSDNTFLSQYFYKKISLVSYIKWERQALLNSAKFDMVFLSTINDENIIEVLKKNGLLVNIGSPSLAKTSYPFNINLEHENLVQWFCACLLLSSKKGWILKKKAFEKKKALILKKKMAMGFSLDRVSKCKLDIKYPKAKKKKIFY